MLNVGIIGLGNTGNQVASVAQKELKIPVLAINSSEKDLETIPNDIPKKLISSAKGGTKGAGKDRKLAKTYLKDSIMKFLTEEDVQNFIKPLEVVFIISSTGGGTGSGTAPLMANIIQKAFVDTKVILVGVLPVNNEALSAHVNTLEYLNELYSILEDQTYMLYDNDRFSDLPSWQMMEKVNSEIVRDINVIRCTYNYTTKFDSIDEQDMLRLVSFPGRITVARLENITEKDCDTKSIEDMLISTIKTNAHVESQRDKKLAASGIIINLAESIFQSFDNHIPKVREFVGDPIHDFNHISINPDRSISNNVFLIMSGLTPINDKIHKISDRVNEIENNQKKDDEDNALGEIDMDKLSGKVADNKSKSTDTEINIKDIFNKFM